MRASNAAGVEIMAFRVSLPVKDLASSLAKNNSKETPVITDVVNWLTLDQPDEKRQPRTTQQSKLAIVGMSCRMPGGATNTEKFWELLENGMDVHRTIPPDRFDVNTHHDPTGKRVNTSHTAYGCFIDEPGLFDAPFFNMSPRK